MVIEDDERASLNFARLIYQYTRIFATINNTQQQQTITQQQDQNTLKEQYTLNYLYLLTLYSDRQRYDSDDMISLCHQYIRELVLGCKDPKVILGARSPEQGRQVNRKKNHYNPKFHHNFCIRKIFITINNLFIFC